MAKNNLTWVLVMDGAHARIFQRDHHSAPLYTIKSLHHTHELTSAHGHDKPGRTFEGGTPERHAYEAKTDWHDHQKEIFAQELAQLFIKEHQGKKFKKAYLVCPAKIMGFLHPYLRSYMKKLPKADKVIIQEIAKDLTHYTLEEVQKTIDLF